MESTTVITNVRVFDGDLVTPPRTVAILDGLITDDTDQPGAEIVDARGGVLLPASSTPTCTSTAAPTSTCAPGRG
jgi:imidazolonepropionase-like amidohydrolase